MVDPTSAINNPSSASEGGRRYSDDGITPLRDPDTTSRTLIKTAEEIALSGNGMIDQKNNNQLGIQTQQEDTSLHSAAEIAMNRQGMAEQVIDGKIAEQNKQEKPVEIVKPAEQGVEKKDPQKISEYLKGVNSSIESLNKLREQYPDNKDIQEQINQLIVNISKNITINASGSQENKSDEQKAVIPEESEEKKEEDKKLAKKKAKRDAIIAGVIGGGTGFGVAVAFGTASAVPASVTLIAGTIITYGAKRIGERVIPKTEKALKQENISQEEKSRLERKLSNWNKVYTWATHGFNFFKGFGIGLAGGAFVSRTFLGGQGLIEKLSTHASTTQTTSGNLTDRFSTSGRTKLEESPLDRGSSMTGSVSETARTSISPSDTGLIQNGRVNLPGSAWNGNLASDPIKEGSELLSRSFTGGQYNMAAYHLNKDLAEAGLRVSDLTGKMGTEGVHRLLNGYLNAIRAGTSNPALRTVLESSNITGSSDILSMIP